MRQYKSPASLYSDSSCSLCNQNWCKRTFQHILKLFFISPPPVSVLYLVTIATSKRDSKLLSMLYLSKKTYKVTAKSAFVNILVHDISFILDKTHFNLQLCMFCVGFYLNNCISTYIKLSFENMWTKNRELLCISVKV